MLFGSPHEPLRLTFGLLARAVGDRSYFERIDFVLNTPAINSFVCETLRDSCADVWAANDLTSLGECKAKLAALPVDEGEILYRDGNTCAPSLRPLFDPPLSDEAGHTSFARIKCPDMYILHRCNHAHSRVPPHLRAGAQARVPLAARGLRLNEREPLRAPLLQAHGRPQGQGQVSGVRAAAGVGPFQR